MAKFNEKSIAVGIGIGLILASILNIRVASKPIPLETLEEQAQKYYGKVLVPEGFENSVITPTPTIAAVTNSPTITPTVNPTDLPTVAPTVEPTVEPTATPTSVVKPITVSFTVTNNTTSETVAVWLAKGGIVDKSQFLQELDRRGLATRIRNGGYTFKKGMTLDQVIKALTGR